MSIYKDCDIRGIYEREFFPADAYAIGQALGEMLEGKPLLLAGDARVSTPVLKKALLEGLLHCGGQVMDLGTIPTPMAYFAKSALGGDDHALAIVTASHNPAQYNGIKLMLDREPPKPELFQTIARRVSRGGFEGRSGSLGQYDILPQYRQALRDRFPRCGGHILVDGGNGIAGRYAPQLLRELGFQVTELYCNVDGTFPDRSPNPANTACLTAAKQRVKEAGADFAVAFDGDGDRAVFLDEQGQVLPSEKAMVLLLRALEPEAGFTMVYDQKSSSLVEREIRAMGGSPRMERSGHAFIKQTLLSTGACLGGEVSGHFFFGELGYDDALFAACLLGDYLARQGRPLSALAGELPAACISPDIRIPVEYSRQDQVLSKVEQMFRDRPINRLDGLRVQLPEGWLLVRKSVTEAAITLRIEAPDQQRIDQLEDQLRTCFPTF